MKKNESQQDKTLVQSLRDSLSTSRLPRHVGIIMDGNGRWARERNKPRTSGHSEGVKTAKRIVKAAAEVGLSYLSLYTFSTENWKRAKEEVSFLMQLIKQHLRNEFQFYKKHRIRVTYSGSPDEIPPKIQHELNVVEKDTRNFNKMTLNLAINYGGRNEIIRAVNNWARSHEDHEKELTEDNLWHYLDHPEIPDLDLIIRTGGEQRISNFFIWKSAYAELYFSPKYWPDWQEEDLFEGLLEFQKRNRRYGGAE